VILDEIGRNEIGISEISLFAIIVGINFRTPQFCLLSSDSVFWQSPLALFSSPLQQGYRLPFQSVKISYAPHLFCPTPYLVREIGGLIAFYL